METERTDLPGIGMRHDFRTVRGQRGAVISHYSGRRDLVMYHPHDPDTAQVILSLNAGEAAGVAELLDTSRIVERLAEIQKQVTGLVTAQVPVNPGSPYAGRRLGETQARTRTGASIVAVLREGHVIASPGPDFGFSAGDIVVVVGTSEGTSAVADILVNG